MEAIKKILRTPSAFVLLLVAIITFIGAIIKGASDKAIARMPIDATLTAEARLTAGAIVPSPTIAILSTETSMPTSMPDVTPTFTPTATSWLIDPFSALVLKPVDSSSTQSITVDITFRNDSSTPLRLVIYGNEGSPIIAVSIPAETSQTFRLPPGNYTYEYIAGCYHCSGYSESGNISLSLTELEAICIGQSFDRILSFCPNPDP